MLSFFASDSPELAHDVRYQNLFPQALRMIPYRPEKIALNGDSHVRDGLHQLCHRCYGPDLRLIDFVPSSALLFPAFATP
jgi:hypothetical protein